MNPFLGVLFHWLGGLAAGSFYVPYRGVRHWAWETYWLVGGVFSWLIAPIAVAAVMIPHLGAVLAESPGPALGWSFFFGILWGVGGLTFGLTMRYLGLSLGYGIALGYCAVFGTLVPPLFRGEFADKLLTPRSGWVVLLGMGICLVGIAGNALAGRLKERELPKEKKQEAVAEFDFWKGMGIAAFAGIMSSCFAFGLAAGAPIKAIALEHGVPELWKGLPVLVVILLGGFTTNCLWCVALHFQNRTGYQYLERRTRAGRAAPERNGNEASATPPGTAVPLARNYVLCALGGVTWYFQFFFYSMGETQMGKYGFSSWTLHMASIIIFSTLWGVVLKEWRSASPRARRLLAFGLGMLVVSTVVVGYGNFLAARQS
jgi:L-rhamnose-H+ transport protein